MLTEANKESSNTVSFRDSTTGISSNNASRIHDMAEMVTQHSSSSVEKGAMDQQAIQESRENLESAPEGLFEREYLSGLQLHLTTIAYVKEDVSQPTSNR